MLTDHDLQQGLELDDADVLVGLGFCSGCSISRLHSIKITILYIYKDFCFMVINVKRRVMVNTLKSVTFEIELVNTEQFRSERKQV